jgi:hypothetical protein
MTRSGSLLLIAILALAGCGRLTPLKRATDAPPLPVAVGATRPATADELMNPSSQSRPQRNVDILTRSEKRPTNQFDIPPGPNNGR